jgi:hypothetical protein
MLSVQKTPILSVLYSTAILLVIVTVSCGIITATDEVANTKYSAIDPFSYGFAVAEEGTLEVRAVNGPVEICAVQAEGTVLVWGERRVESESIADAEAHLRQLFVKTKSSRHSVSIETEQPEHANGRNYEVSYHIRVPIGWRVKTRHVNVDIEEKSLVGDLSLDFTNGEGVLR